MNSSPILCCVCSAHKEVLHLRYEDYAKCVSEHHLIRMKALVEVQEAAEPVMAVVTIPLRMPELLIQVGPHSLSFELVDVH